MKINVSTPVYNVEKGTAIIQLSTNSHDTSDVVIDFKNLLPYANKVSSLVIDFFIITAVTYAIDRFVERRRNSIDGWTRELEVTYPATNHSQYNKLKHEFEEMLSFLTGDYWNVRFKKSKFDFPNGDIDPLFEDTYSQVNLFSGGLDSLIGALDFLKSKPLEKVIFISHYDPKMGGPLNDQKDVLKLIKPIYGNQYIHVASIKVSMMNSTFSKSETTLRSRSILFNGLALMIAEATNVPKIIVPENGSVSLNYPLSPSRRSACSTRTTHPTVLSLMQNIWLKLGINKSLINPYELDTKGEMVTNCKDLTNLLKIISTSNSCGKRGHRAHWDLGKRNSSHCGVCMPCVYRRAALLTQNDLTTYGNDINSLPPFKTKKGQDISACLEFLRNSHSKDEVKQELIVNGVRDVSKLDLYAELVIRTKRELLAWVKSVGNPLVKEKAGIT